MFNSCWRCWSSDKLISHPLPPYSPKSKTKEWEKMGWLSLFSFITSWQTLSCSKECLSHFPCILHFSPHQRRRHCPYFMQWRAVAHFFPQNQHILHFRFFQVWINLYWSVWNVKPVDNGIIFLLKKFFLANWFARYYYLNLQFFNNKN